MNRLLKKIADLILVCVALLGLLNLLPLKISGTDLMIITGLILFIIFVILITHHTSKLEKKIEILVKEREIDKRLIKIENKLKL